MLNIFYTVIIYPLIQIIEFAYRVSYKIFENAGLSVISVSITVTFLCLPLYIIAEKWQHIERDTIRRLKPKIDKIKTVFKGDEQYMILSTYYRQNHYHPLYSLRNSFGILIQIPFFIAAYSFLSHLESLKSVSFYFIQDLSKADGLLSIGAGSHLNILPILMTLINCISGMIYTKSLYTRDKIQVYGTAAVFLILLYNSPSGLVLYWTMNNVFSLIKNIFYKLKNPTFILYIILCITVLLLDTFLLFFHHGDIYKRSILIVATLLIPASPVLIKFSNFLLGTLLYPLHADKQKRAILFFTSLGLICLFAGFVIPSYIISSSPQEFSYIESVLSPFSFLGNTFLQAFGFTVFWPICIYFLFGSKIKSLLAAIAPLLFFGSLINTYLFSGEYGELSTLLTFSNAGLIRPSFYSTLINIIVMLALVAAIIFLIYKNRIKIFFVINIIILFALLGISVVHSISILKEFNQFTIMRNSTEESKATLSPIFNFSKEGKNVIVIMLDRAISSFVPEIFSEIPELYNQFSGFVYYPNTVSFNIQTLMGAPPLFGGYEYTPKEINKRSDEPLVKKHNESLLLMPVIFSSNNFSVTVTDPPWANYSWIPDIRIYKNYPDIKVYNTIRSYTDTWLNKNNFSKLQLKSKILKRNFIWFSLFKSAPLALRYAIYNSGDWWSTDKMTIDFRQILNNYAVLDFLPILTDTNTDKKNTFTLMQNEMTHEPAFLQAPGYIPVPAVTNKGNSKFANISNYPSNAAALRLLGIWFDHLASMGVYNNTRIIIVADHSAGIDTGAFADAPTLPFNREALNPLLMVKDFDANFPLKTDATFMTNADVPTLAFKDIIDDPVNPFTGNPVTDTMKKYPLLITTSGKWMPFAHHTNTFIINNDEWYSVHDNIFDAQNWQKVE